MKLKGQRNQCQGCKHYFNSNVAFDKHRVGHHGVDRRCLTPEEMKKKGMVINHAGFWITMAYDPKITYSEITNRGKHEETEES